MTDGSNDSRLAVAPLGEPYERNEICFVGRMDYYPNQQCMFEFCANTLPRLRQERPDLKLTIVGADHSAAVQKLGQLPGVTVTGSVPDVRPFVRRSALMIAPLNIARGTQNKILEAMAMGVPVVTSRIAAGRGGRCGRAGTFPRCRDARAIQCRGASYNRRPSRAVTPG